LSGGGACSIAVAPSVAGFCAIAVVVAIWAGFALSIRAIGASPLAAADVALIRFGLPVILLLPFLPSRLPALRRVRAADAAMVVAGAGLPFFFIATAGGAATSATHVGALIAGTSPLSVAILGSALEGRRIGAARWRAIGIILAGVAALLLPQASVAPMAMAQGAGLLLLASLLWASYTLGLRRTGLDAIGCTLLLSLPSLAVLVILVLTGAVESHIGQFSLAQAAPFVLVQGLGVGVVASLAYAFAISRLGPARSAVIGSLAPALACLLAVPLLGEQLTPLILAGVAAITIGVVRANRS
jgi:drug/metabolite transporter (DMT)-like permease